MLTSEKANFMFEQSELLDVKMLAVLLREWYKMHENAPPSPGELLREVVE